MPIRLPTIAAALAVFAVPNAALCHVTLETQRAVAGTAYKAVIRVPHGCDGSPTIAIHVRIPDGVIGVKPQPKPGWSVNIVRAKLPAPVTNAHGHTVTEAVREIDWSGGRLPDDNYDEFVMRLELPDTPNLTLFFPIVQQCEKGVHRWIEIPEGGRPRSDYREPAPSLRLLPKTR